MTVLTLTSILATLHQKWWPKTLRRKSNDRQHTNTSSESTKIHRATKRTVVMRGWLLFRKSLKLRLKTNQSKVQRGRRALISILYKRRIRMISQWLRCLVDRVRIWKEKNQAVSSNLGLNTTYKLISSALTLKITIILQMKLHPNRLRIRMLLQKIWEVGRTVLTSRSKVIFSWFKRKKDTIKRTRVTHLILQTTVRHKIPQLTLVAEWGKLHFRVT